MFIMMLIGAMAAPPAFELRSWIYPHDRVISEGGGGADVGSGAHTEKYRRVSMTTDPFDKVVEFYRRQAALTIQNGSDKDGTIIDDSRHRPLSLVTIIRRYGDISVVVVISRGHGELVTHIALDYRQPLR